MSNIEIVNSYDNTEMLLKSFPIVNPTPVKTRMEKNIQNRLLTGFENWNRGTEAWMEWGNILYTEDSLYNVHGVHLTLKEYQMTSSLSFKSNQMMMGNFNNMIICGDWTAIRYDISSKNRETGEIVPGSVMEFVKFKDYGEKLGTRVVEGWAGTVGKDYSGLMHFLSEEEQDAQNAFMDSIVNYEIPETDDLVKKYPVKYPTPDNSPIAAQIKTAILQEFDLWNQGCEAWLAGMDKFYSNDLSYHIDQKDMDMEKYRAYVKDAFETNITTRVYFENILISGEWAAVHYRVKNQDKNTGKVSAKNEMKFLHFATENDTIKIIECWAK